MSECILFYTKLHCDESLAPSELEGILPHMAYTGMCRRQGMVSDLSVLNEVCNFVRVCQQGIACTTGFICWINFVQYKGNDYNVNCCNAFANSAACILSFALNRVVKLRALS